MKTPLNSFCLTGLLLIFLLPASSLFAQQDDLTNDNWNWPNSSPGIAGPNPTPSVSDVVIVDNTIYAVGRINAAGGLEAFRFAIYDDDTNQWDATPDGPNDSAWAIDRHESRLYLGGQFTQVAGETAQYMAIWNMDSESWEPFNEGINDRVRLIHIAGDYMFIVGEFSAIGELQAEGIARYSFSTGEWDNMGGGIPDANPRIEVLESEGDLLYVGGWFTEISGLDSPSLAIYNMISGEWSSLGTQGSGTYYAIEFEEDYIWLGGSSTVAPDGSPIRKIMRYNRSTGEFSGVGPVLEDPAIQIHSLLRSGDYLYAGGRNWDSVEGDDSIRNFARLHLPTEQWEPIGDNSSNITGTFSGLNKFRGEILAHGSITRIGGAATGRIVSYIEEEGQIRMLGNGLPHGTRVNALTRAVDSIFIGGFFLDTGIYNARFVGSFMPGNRTWQQVPLLPGNLNGEVFAVLEHEGYVYVGGSFATSGTQPTNRLMSFNLATQSWESIIPEGESLQGGSVLAFAAHEDNLYIAGGLTSIAGVPGSRIMRYHIPTGTYHPLGEGTNARINDLVIHDGYLYAAGDFTEAGGQNTGRVARYSLSGETWEPVDAVSPNEEVFALMVHDDYLYIGGNFTNLVESSARYVAKLNLAGQGGWERAGNTLDSGSGFGVRALAMLEGTLYIGGLFDSYMGTQLNNIARLADNGTSWLPLGFGVNGRVDDFLVWETDLWLSGRFTRAGNQPAAGLTVWSLDLDYTPPVSIGPDPIDLPSTVKLYQNYPNPFNPGTTIRYTLPESGHVSLEVFNIAGQQVATLVNASQTQGTHTAVFDGSRLSSGVYLYRITVNGQALTRKMMLVK